MISCTLVQALYSTSLYSMNLLQKQQMTLRVNQLVASREDSSLFINIHFFLQNLTIIFFTVNVHHLVTEIIGMSTTSGILIAIAYTRE